MAMDLWTFFVVSFFFCMNEIFAMMVLCDKSHDGDIESHDLNKLTSTNLQLNFYHHPIPPELVLMAPWVTKKYSPVLISFQERFKHAKPSKRVDVIKQVVKDIKAIADQDGVAIPPNIEKVQPLDDDICLPLYLFKKIRTWFQNNWDSKGTSRPEPKADARLRTTWTVRKVVKEQMAAELNALVLQKDSSALPGTKGYMRHVQECLTVLVQGLSEDKEQEFTALANEWNSAGVDADKQAKSVAPIYLIDSDSSRW